MYMYTHTHTHTHTTHTMEYYSAIKMNDILPFTTWTDPEDIMLSEISQTEKDKYHMISYMCNLKRRRKKKKTSKQPKSRNRPINITMRLSEAGGGEAWVKWVKWVKGSKRYRTPVTECINHKNERYSIGI